VNSVTENGNPVTNGSTVNFIRSEKGYAVYGVGSGSYLFSSVINK
jgi:hypothetical protein